MTDNTPKTSLLQELPGPAGATGTSQGFHGLSWSRLRKALRDHRDQAADPRTEDCSVVPVVPSGKARSGPANPLNLKHGPGGPGGPGSECSGWKSESLDGQTQCKRPALQIKDRLYGAASVAEIDHVMRTEESRIEAIAALDEPIWAVEAIHIRNLADYRKKVLKEEGSR